MANPQAENGHIDIANEIAEALMRTNFSAYQMRILWAIWRKTYGWKKKEDWISNSQLIEMTGIAKGHISRTKKELLMRNIIVTNSGNKIAFNKDYTQWKELPIGVRGYQFGQKVTPSGKKVTPSGGYKRNYTKETIQKKKLYCQNSIEFRLSDLLFSRILERNKNFKEPNIQEWSLCIDRMIRLDKRDPTQIERVIEWCQQDEFWQNNILSMDKLRKQFDQLFMKMNQKPQKKGFSSERLAKNLLEVDFD